ncbi:SHOCT domain-containing protein [Xanthomonas sp. 3058]|uniref:SHOCT domain-containing protein n=1 Tax=Xanthomonas sp. 3058 TaxID=3035314 RepID=UPI00160DE964|nr:SHOCT domain-containing protein [Xanthomonas sp. 3058]MBB5864576.1 cytochrome c-type biogenesis protein CcmH/NrfG [Xanthomonas sp. 3058]
MGSFSIWHWLILLVIFGIAAAVIALVVWAAKRATRASVTSATPHSTAINTVQSRLAELETLKSQQVITEAEYNQRRARILDGI